MFGGGIEMDDYTNEQLLLELIRRNGTQPAPKRTEYYGDGWLTCTVGIGKDASVSLTFDKDDLAQLAIEALTCKYVVPLSAFRHM